MLIIAFLNIIKSFLIKIREVYLSFYLINLLYGGFYISVEFSPLFILYKHPGFRLFYKTGRFFVYSYISVNSLGRLFIKKAYLP
jgi:hypothetical protein